MASDWADTPWPQLLTAPLGISGMSVADRAQEVGHGSLSGSYQPQNFLL